MEQETSVTNYIERLMESVGGVENTYITIDAACK